MRLQNIFFFRSLFFSQSTTDVIHACGNIEYGPHELFSEFYEIIMYLFLFLCQLKAGEPGSHNAFLYDFVVIDNTICIHFNGPFRFYGKYMYLENFSVYIHSFCYIHM